MPHYTAHEVADIARNVYLNRGGISDTAMLPLINNEYEALQHILIEHDVPVMRKTFAPITIVIGATTIPEGTTVGCLPTDFVAPLFLWEKSENDLDVNYTPMVEKNEMPIITPSDRLIYWVWDGEEIKLLGATTTRVVLIRGYKFFPYLTEAMQELHISFAKSYLACAVAAQAALTISHNPTMAKELDMKAHDKLDKILSKYVKKNQTLRFRRRGYRRPGM